MYIKNYLINILYKITMLFCTVKKLISENLTEKVFKKNDLFVLIQCNNKTYRSMVHWNDNKPVWNEQYVFDELFNKKNLKVKLKLCDADKTGKNETLYTEEFVLKKGVKVEKKTLAGVETEWKFVEVMSTEDKEELSNKCKKLEEYGKNLEGKIGDLEKNNSVLFNDNEELKNLNVLLEDMKIELQNKNTVFENNNNELKNLLDNFKSEYTDLNKNYLNMKDKIVKARNELISLDL